MTSPALFVLFLAHVCSIIGTANLAADHDIKLASKQTNMRPITTHNTNLWTNKNLDIYDRSNIHSTLRNFEISTVYDKMIGKIRHKREDSSCEGFLYNNKDKDHFITHPHSRNNKTYYSNSNCVTVIEAPKDNVIQLTFVDHFHIEDQPNCDYDYLEIRDGKQGYSKLLDRFCGKMFPRQLITSGPYAWLKFKSDDTIEYDGFKILIEYKRAASQSVPESCYYSLDNERSGKLQLPTDDQCIKDSPTNLDILWTITTLPNYKIYLNFTEFALASPNECELNVVEIFGAKPEMEDILAQYCGSIANPVSTKTSDVKGTGAENIMNVRIFVSSTSREKTKFQATYTAFRALDPNKDETCNDDEFDCDDNTCIDIDLKCDKEAHCRLKTDEDYELCKEVTTSTISEPHIMIILIIFSLILFAMSFIFLFKCIRKLYHDHKIIKEHIRESCEDRLDMVGSRLTLDAKRLQRDSEPRASLERENQANEMFKRKRESFSKRKPTSIDSDYIQETHVDLDEEPWRREVDCVPIESDVRIERNGRTRRSERERHEQDRRSERGSEKQSERRSDMSKKEESIRSRRETEEKEKKEIRDVSVGAPDTKESSCQTRESLFQADAPPSSDGSGTTGTNSRGFSTFGYSGATIVRPSPPTTNTSEITIELLRQVPRQDSVKPQKKISDRRPISTETTRSAPDVIIVSKPIR